MKTTVCEHEPAVLAALDDGNWAPGLREHVTTCATCSDTVLVAGFLRQQAEQTAASPLPDPDYIWWRAQHQVRAERARRATLPITIVQRIAMLCGLAAALTVLFRAGPWLSTHFPGFSFASAASSPSQPLPLLLTGVGLLLVLGLLDLFNRWAEA